MRLPLLGFAVAKELHAPNAIGIFENGVVRDWPALESIFTMSDPPNVAHALCCGGLLDVMYLLQSGRVDLGYIGGAEIDPFGNLNTHWVEDNGKRTRLPGSGGAADIAALAKRRILIMNHERRRFTPLRGRAAHRDERRSTLREEQWLLIEWPAGQPEPTKYWLATLPADSALVDLVKTAKMRWRIERDYQELKQEFGLSHYEGRGWRGFHHHATVCIAAYGFLLADRLRHGGIKKNSIRSKAPRLPAGYTPRGSPTHATSRARFHRDVALSAGVRDRQPT